MDRNVSETKELVSHEVHYLSPFDGFVFRRSSRSAMASVRTSFRRGLFKRCCYNCISHRPCNTTTDTNLDSTAQLRCLRYRQDRSALVAALTVRAELRRATGGVGHRLHEREVCGWEGCMCVCVREVCVRIVCGRAGARVERERCAHPRPRRIVRSWRGVVRIVCVGRDVVRVVPTGKSAVRVGRGGVVPLWRRRLG